MIVIKDKKDWNSILCEKFPEHDIYFKYEYFNLYQKHYDAIPEALFWEDDNLKIFWTHLVRDIPSIEISKKLPFHDSTTPYGYGGPLIIVKKKDYLKKSLDKFLKVYRNHYLKENNVSEFVRFHPVYSNPEYFNNLFETEHINDIVLVDLNKGLDQIWADFSKNTKRYIRKGQKEFENVIVKKNPSNKELKLFQSLYIETMKKNKASERYFFNFEFIKDHFDLLNARLIYCEDFSGELGSAAIILESPNSISYHLGASNYKFKNSPLRLILWESIKFGKDKGYEFFNLGGGLKKNDSLFKFKSGFSNITSKFYIGKIIFNKNIYKSLVTPETSEEVNFFPIYRSLNKKLL